MVFRKPLNAITSQIKLVNFGHNGFKSHGSASFCEAKKGELQMDCLGQRISKRRQVGTTPELILSCPVVRRVVQNNVEQRAVDFQNTVVLNET